VRACYDWAPARLSSLLTMQLWTAEETSRRKSPFLRDLTVLTVPTALRIALSKMNQESFEIGWSLSTDWTTNHLSQWQSTLSFAFSDVDNEVVIGEAMLNLYFKIGSVCPSVCATVSASINPLYPATDCAAATDVSGVSGRWQLSR